MLNTKRLEYFIAVAQSQSMRQAAERLHISQPPLSRAIAQLEEEVGVRLFERTQRGLRITTQGQHFLRSAQDIIRRSDELVEETRRMTEGRGGVIRVTLTSGFKHGPLPLAMSKFLARHPEVHITTDTGYSSDLLKKLQDAQSDLLLMPMPLPANASGLESRNLGAVKLCLLVSPRHKLARKRSIRLKEAVHEKFIFGRLLPGSGYYQPVMDALRHADIAPDLMTDVTPSEVIAGLVGLGTGVTIDAAESMPANRLGLRSVPIVDPPIYIERGVVFRRGTVTRLMQDFMDELVAAFHAGR